MRLWSSRPFWLENLVYLDPELGPLPTSFCITNGRVASEERRPERGDLRVDLGGALVLPGLVNAHDHLHLNNFPVLKFRERYTDAEEWTLDVEPRLTSDPVISAARQVPLRDRLFIGVLKNLLAGATTVSHHDQLYPPLRERWPVRIITRYGWSHSLYRGADPAASYRATPPSQPWIIHLAEGISSAAQSEFSSLEKLGCLGKNTVVVHGVGLNADDRWRLAERGAGLVWCPSSNLTLLGATAQVKELASMRRLAIGSDSRISGSRDLLDELTCARSTGQLDPRGLYLPATIDAGRILQQEVGKLAPQRGADLIILDPPGKDPFEWIGSIRRADLRAIFVRGKLLMADPKFSALMSSPARACLDGRRKLFDRDLAARYRRCTIREPGLELDHDSRN